MRVLRKVFCNVWAYVSCRGYVCILSSARYFAVNQGGTADNLLCSSLIEIKIFLSRAFLFFYASLTELSKEHFLF